MNVWYHLSTIFKQRHALQVAGLIALCVAITTTLLFGAPSHAATGVNQTLSFQGRLLNSSGGIVADGYYNMQFKIYQDGAGTAVGNPGGTLKWTENYVNNGGNNGVEVKNGYFSANLGSRTAFGTSIDWNQDTLWLSMNVAGSSTSCTAFGTAPCSADGEMLPMKQLTSTPFALNSAQLGGKTADGFLQNTTSLQSNTSLAIQSAGDSDVTAYLQGRTNQTATSLLIKQGSSQTGKAFDIQDASSASLFNIDASGNLNAASGGAFGGHLAVGVTRDSGIQLKVVAESGSVGAQITGNGTNDILRLNSGNGNTQVLSVADNGDTTIQNKTDSTSAFQVKNAAGNSYVTADSTNQSLTTSNLNVGDSSNVGGASRLFSDGFETGDTSQWSGQNVSGSSTAAIDATKKHGGKYSMKFVNAGTPSLIYKSITGAATTYVRGYVYIDSQTSNGLDFLTLGSGSSRFSLFRNSGGYLGAYNEIANASYIGSPLSMSGWHEVEMKLVISPTAGAITVWVDGNQDITQTNLNTGSVNPNYIQIGDPNSGRAWTAYLDDVAVDTVRPGQSASLNVNDNLHVAGGSSFGGDVSVQGSVYAQGDLQITGGITANTLQGNTSVIAPLFDRADAGALNIGTVNASTINMGTNNVDHTINIGTGTGGNQTITIGSLYSSSSILLQGGDQGVRLASRGGFGFRNDGAAYDAFQIWQNGGINVQTASGMGMYVSNSGGHNLFNINDDGNIQATDQTVFTFSGGANFEKGITIQGSTSTTEYISPVTGAHLHTAINIPNYAVPAYGSIFAFGLPSTSDATARGMVVADGRTGTHQATIGVLSPDENQVLGLSWKSDAGTGANQIGTLTNTANSLALQGNGLNLLTATNNGGAANVGIGNNAGAGYALDVTGDINSSTQYRVNGVTTLTNTALTFSGASDSTVTSAASQNLVLDGKAGTIIKTNGATRATFDTSNTLFLGNGASSATPTNFAIQATNSSATAVAGASLTIQGGSATTGNANGGDLALDAGAKSGTGTGGAMILGATNASSITIGRTASNIVTTILGNFISKPTTGNDSTTAFQIQRANGTAMLVADSTNQTITIGNSGSGNYTVISTSTGQITKYGTARNTKKITLNAEYTGSVLDPGTGSSNTGIMTSSIDLTNRMNYYKWTTSQATNQSYDVVVQVPIPTDFDGWASSNPLAISTYTSNTTNGTITLEARDSSGTVQCNFVSVTPGSTGTWATNTSACTLSSGTYAADDYMTFRIRMQSPTSGDVRIGNINLSYLSKY